MRQTEEKPPMMMVSPDQLSEVDFADAGLILGMRLERKEMEGGGYLALGPDDWAVLYKLLTTRIPMEVGSIRAVDESNNMQLLARFAKGAVEWYARTGTPSRMDSPAEPWKED